MEWPPASRLIKILMNATVHTLEYIIILDINWGWLLSCATATLLTYCIFIINYLILCASLLCAVIFRYVIVFLTLGRIRFGLDLLETKQFSQLWQMDNMCNNWSHVYEQQTEFYNQTP